MPITPGEVTFGENGIPQSPEYGDVYHSADGGLDQSRLVFLQGCDLPNAWQDTQRFVILETGFGLGLNFLATWAAFRKHPGHCRALHFLAIEKHPVSLDSLVRCHPAWPGLADLARELQARWPLPVAGYHRLGFDQDRVALTLVFDDAEAALKQLEAKADAIYLDGFAPGRNPAMWSPAVLDQLGRLAAPGARLATWCVAGAVRQGLQQAGFTVERKPGFGRKKERLEAHFTHASRPTPCASPRQATLIGAGIAGVCLAQALIARGWAVTLIERHPRPAEGASGNPAGVVRPQLTLDESFNGRLSRQAFLHTTNTITALAEESPGATRHPLYQGGSLSPTHAFEGALHLARNEEQADRMPAMLAAHQYPESFARWVGEEEAGALAGVAVTAPGLYFPRGGWMAGPRVAEALLALCGEPLARHFTRAATRLEQTDQGWRVWEDGMLLAESPVVVLTGAHEAAHFARLPLTPVRGQVTTLPDGSLPDLVIPVTREGYVLPTRHGIGNIGASFAFDDDPLPHDADQAGNLDRLGRLLERPPALDPGTLGARVSFRAATPDRLPLCGAIADDEAPFPPELSLQRLPRLEGLHALTGLGARGLGWGPFLAQALAARLDGEPGWLAHDLWQALDPARFLLRKTRRGR
jgi:tRNA 5-methylaminomethyl-2-thiouridine biosynthesis bifunctional protein